jgi:hypothetical protein
MTASADQQDTPAPYPIEGSHLPVLAMCCATLTEPADSIIEFGAGKCSTPLLGCATAVSRATLLTIEGSEEWKPTPSHSRHTTAELVTATQWSKSRWKLAFVDHESSLRASTIRLLRETFWSANLIVVHDTEPQSEHIYRFEKYGVLSGCDRIDITCPFYGVRTTVVGIDISPPLRHYLGKLDAMTPITPRENWEMDDWETDELAYREALVARRENAQAWCRHTMDAAYHMWGVNFR